LWKEPEVFCAHRTTDYFEGNEQRDASGKPIKRLELLRELVPGATKIALLANPGVPATAARVRASAARISHGCSRGRGGS